MDWCGDVSLKAGLGPEDSVLDEVNDAKELIQIVLHRSTCQDDLLLRHVESLQALSQLGRSVLGPMTFVNHHDVPDSKIQMI